MSPSSVQVKKKMSMEDFQRNTRGINANADFPPEFLSELFNTIACKGFRIPASPQDLLQQPSMLPSRGSLKGQVPLPCSASVKQL